jgi:uncharacterized protein (TIGR02145 family)
MSKASLVKIGDKSITRYSNALVRRTLEEIAVNNSTKQNKTDLLTRKSNDLAVAIKEVKIGDQIWSTENLNVERYRNGDPIPEVKDPDEWSKLKTGAWCYYDNDPENGKKYGKLYNWYAVNDPRGLAPEGWHVPTKKEFEKLIETLHESGNTLRIIVQDDDLGAGTNTSGFSALMAGYRTSHYKFTNLGYYTYFWSSTDCYDSPYLTDNAHYVYLYYDSSIYFHYHYKKEYGFSVRCVKD